MTTIAHRCQHAVRCVDCGAYVIYYPAGGRWVHEDPTASLSVDHAARAALVAPSRVPGEET